LHRAGSFSGTAPSPLSEKAGTPEPSGGSAVGPVDRSDYALAGVIGAQLSEPLSIMQHVVQEFTRTRKISRTQMQQLQMAIETARTVAKQSQQISRLAGGRLRQSHERLSLHDLLNQELDQHQASFQRSGIELYRSIKPVDVIVDPGLLSSLVDAAIECAAVPGRRLAVSLEIKNWPEHGMLFLKTSDSIAEGGIPNEGREDHNPLSWHLLTHIGQVMGVTVDRVASASEMILMIEFPRTVKQLEGLTAVEVDGGGDSSMHSESKPLAGHRILLITTDEMLISTIKMICRSMGLIVDTVPNSRQAVRFCELDVPHMIIIDERLHDAPLDELRRDLHKVDPNLPFLEIATASNTLEMASWMSDSMTRVSRDSLRSQLPSIMVFELAKVI
jgi:CheY-like chemotaxis protein